MSLFAGLILFPSIKKNSFFPKTDPLIGPPNPWLMYFFYIDESGTKDPKVAAFRKDGTAYSKEHLYVLTAVSLFEFEWKKFEREVTNLKLELSDNLKRRAGIHLSLAECEVKSCWFRVPKQREKESRFLHLLTDSERTRLADLFFDQLTSRKMNLFSVVVDKRKLRDHVNHDILFKKAFELLLERIEHFLREYHSKHQGLVVIDDNGRQANRSLAMKHAFIQREGNQVTHFRHIVEYPMFTDSALSNGVQLADLCGYCVYRAFRGADYQYPWFQRILPRFYTSEKTNSGKLDGLKVWPNDSELVEFGRTGWANHKNEQPTLWDGLP